MNAMNKAVFHVLILLFAICAGTYTASACSCGASPAVDIAFQKTANVVVMKLRSIEKYQPSDNGSGYGGIRQARLTVEKSYKGNLKVGSELTFAQGGGADCVWTFGEEDIGTEYLFYLGGGPVKANLWVAITCSRSRPKDYAGADLLYLDKLTAVRGKSRLSGVLIQSIRSPVEDGEFSDKVLPNRKVSIIGNGKKLELKTDANGVYEVYGLGPGKYTVTPEGVEGYAFGYPKRETSAIVTLVGTEHAEENFEFEIDNRLSGTFFDSNGKPLKNVCLELHPARGVEARGLFEMDCTDASGRFSMDEIPAGTYVLVINDDDKVTSDQPFGKFYYPSAKRREDAAEITIGPGEFRDDLIINAPETADVITVSGVVLLEDGRPATDKNTQYVSIEFHTSKINNSGRNDDDDSDPEARTEIDKNGRFNIRILKGQRGTLVATMMTFSGEFEKCPKIERLIAKSGNRLPTIRSTEFQLDGSADIPGVELKFPFPSCRLAKID